MTCCRWKKAIPHHGGLTVTRPKAKPVHYCGTACLVLSNQPAGRTLADMTVVK